MLRGDLPDLEHVVFLGSDDWSNRCRGDPRRPETGRTVARGEAGELCTRGYSVMLGYWSEAEKTAEAIDAARWMHTGDLATMDRVRGGANLTLEAVREHCQGKIAHYKVPRYLHLCDELPMTVTGKVQKLKMRETSIELLGLQDAANTTTA